MIKLGQLHFIYQLNMKKNQQKGSKSGKAKIELKIKSKTITNNYILTPRTSSPHSPKIQYPYRPDKFTEEIKNEKNKHDAMGTIRSARQPKRNDYRVINTEQQRILKKKYEDDETGTQTPMVKRISLNSQPGKKKSSHSLTVGDKPKKKLSQKIGNSQSGQLSKGTMQRLISVIIKDYREGKLTQKDLERTLMELYERREKGKASNKKSKKKNVFNGFSNEFLRSSQQTKSEALVRRRKKSDEIQERVLQRNGIVNKIIIKGITTSLFLKEEPDFSNIKQNESKVRNPQKSHHFNTSKSIIEIKEDIKNIQEKYQQIQEATVEMQLSLQQKMAVKIQRAWRRYRTNKILKLISQKNQNNQSPIYEDIDSFADQQDQFAPKTLKRSSAPETSFQKMDNFTELVRIITENFHQKNVSKEQCLKNIMKCLQLSEELIVIHEHEEQDKKDEAEAEKKLPQLNLQPYEFEDEADDQSDEEGQGSLIKVSRVKMSNDEEEKSKQQEFQQNLQALPSNDLNSFTNKYSSKEVVDNPNDNLHQTEQLDQSLTFGHNQAITMTQAFKMFNIQSIEDGLRSRETALQLKKVKELEEITQKYLNNKIGKETYLTEKAKIDKWFRYQLKQLRNIKNSLMKTCSDAQKMLEDNYTTLKREKSSKMLKCLSDKYIRKDWLVRPSKKKQSVRTNSQEEDILRTTHINSEKTATERLEDDERVLSFEKQDEFETQVETKIMRSPKMSRHQEEEEEDINEYKYQQIEKMIDDEDDDGLDEGLPQLDNKRILFDKIEEDMNEDEEVEEHQLSLIHNLLNQTTKKLKYLCTEDKEDIFEFLFLDLILEPFTEAYIGQARILKSAEGHINKTKRLKKIPKGIKTNLQASKEYLKTVNNYVLENRNNLKNLSAPMGPSAAEMLKYMRDEMVEMQEDNVASTLVLPLDLFETVGKLPEMNLKLERYYDDDEREESRVSFLKTALHIHNKALFDSVNEMLDHERPYGVWGKPFPWKKTMNIDRKWSAEIEEKKLKKGIERTVESCSYLCGILVDKQDSLFGNHRVSDDYVFQIREDRLSKMLANELIENEERWIFYDDEQTEILMEVCSFVTKKLIKEIVLDLSMLSLKF